MKNIIIIYCLIFSSISAQENRNIFNLIIRSGIGVNKLLTIGDGQISSIPTNSNVGLNFSIGGLIEYNKFSKIQIYTGLGFKIIQLHTKISNIITGVTISKGLDPTEISESYTNNYLSIPLLFNFNIKEKQYLGCGISYDYLLNTKISKSISNNSDPELEKIGNKFYPAMYSFLLNYKYIFNKHISILPTILISPNKTTSKIFSNSTGPSISLDIHFELKI